jgi:hypothetical protein
VTAVECGAGYVPFIVELEQNVKSNNMYWKKATKAIAFIHPTPYATTSASDRVEEKGGVKEWNDG